MTQTLEIQTHAATITLDAWVRELMQWHFNQATGCPFWLDWAAKAGWDPRREVQSYADLSKFGFFQDEWLRGGPVRRWVPKAYADRPISVFETGALPGSPRPASTSTTSAPTTNGSVPRYPTRRFRKGPTG